MAIDLNQLRVETLKRLIGSDQLKQFAERYDLDASYLSQIINGHRNIGERAAANLEEKIGLHPFSLIHPNIGKQKIHPPHKIQEIKPLERKIATEKTMITLEELQRDIGSSYTKNLIQRLLKFAYIPPKVLSGLASQALSEKWGKDLHVLKKYLAVNIAWSIEQGKVTFSDDQFYVSAGNLQTRYGTPLYLVFIRGTNPEKTPWMLIKAGSQINAPALPSPPEIPKGPEIPRGAEIVMQHDHMLKDNEDRVVFLKDAPPVAQMCALSGAIQWSLNRGLQLPYWYYGRMNYLVPLYLRDRENITNAPDLVAPIQVTNEMLLVRTVLEPYMPYANSRVAVFRHDQLPAWMIDTWNAHADAIEDETEEGDQ